MLMKVGAGRGGVSVCSHVVDVSPKNAEVISIKFGTGL